jgi:hypothetical protein
MIILLFSIIVCAYYTSNQHSVAVVDLVLDNLRREVDVGFGACLNLRPIPLR